jgi:lipoate-protein ligase A
MQWRYITDDAVDAAEGLAADEALMLSHGRSMEPAPSILKLYTYADHAALCGRFQHLEAEIDLDACAETGTPYNRRPTGGGAIVMGSGQLGVAVLTRSPAELSPKALLMEFSRGVVEGLATLGIDASFGGKNDLKVDGKKVAGLGLYVDGEGALLFHASILADLDVPFMLDVLSIPAGALGAGAVAAVEARVTTVTRQTGRPWSGVDLRPVIAEGFANALGVELSPSRPTEQERERTTEIAEKKYLTDEWRFMRSPHPDATATSMVRTPHGTIRAYLSLQGDTIKSVFFAGDVNMIPEPVTDFESRLKWDRLSEERVVAAARAAFVDGTGLDVEPAVLVAAVLDAGNRALGREIVAPHRLGSCYFPEQQAVNTGGRR